MSLDPGSLPRPPMSLCQHYVNLLVVGWHLPLCTPRNQHRACPRCPGIVSGMKAKVPPNERTAPPASTPPEHRASPRAGPARPITSRMDGAAWVILQSKLAAFQAPVFNTRCHQGRRCCFARRTAEDAKRCRSMVSASRNSLLLDELVHLTVLDVNVVERAVC